MPQAHQTSVGVPVVGGWHTGTACLSFPLPLGFLIGKDGFKYLTGMLLSLGHLKTPNASISSNFCWSSSSWWLAYWGSLPFHWGGFTGPMFTLASNGPSAPLEPLMLGSKMWSYPSKSDLNFALIS